MVGQSPNRRYRHPCKWQVSKRCLPWSGVHDHRATPADAGVEVGEAGGSHGDFANCISAFAGLAEGQTPAPTLSKRRACAPNPPPALLAAVRPAFSVAVHRFALSYMEQVWNMDCGVTRFGDLAR